MAMRHQNAWIECVKGSRHCLRRPTARWGASPFADTKNIDQPASLASYDPVWDFRTPFRSSNRELSDRWKKGISRNALVLTLPRAKVPLEMSRVLLDRRPPCSQRRRLWKSNKTHAEASSRYWKQNISSQSPIRRLRAGIHFALCPDNGFEPSSFSYYAALRYCSVLPWPHPSIPLLRGHWRWPWSRTLCISGSKSGCRRNRS